MTSNSSDALFNFCLRLGDSNLILGHRLSEWCGHSPILEEDMALMNVALDLLGQTRVLLTYAGEVEGKGRDEDKLAYHRDSFDFRNVQLVENPNGDFAQTIARQCFFDNYHYLLLEKLSVSSDQVLRDHANKALKEVRYHCQHSGEWVVRLGDGTEESHERMQTAINDVWRFTGELFTDTDEDQELATAGVIDLPSSLKQSWNQQISAVLNEATLERPIDVPIPAMGKSGAHSEHLGYLLAEMQFLQRSYPDATW
jgi:ring-1,2-phenylacetyl-CoA epoxidase subunit PaaC